MLQHITDNVIRRVICVLYQWHTKGAPPRKVLPLTDELLSGRPYRDETVSLFVVKSSMSFLYGMPWLGSEMSTQGNEFSLKEGKEFFHVCQFFSYLPVVR